MEIMDLGVCEQCPYRHVWRYFQNLEPTSKLLAPEGWHEVPQMRTRKIHIFEYWGGRNNHRRHHTKFSLVGDMASGICGPLSCPTIWLKMHFIRVTGMPGNSGHGHTTTQLRGKLAAGSTSYRHCHNHHKFQKQTELPSQMCSCVQLISILRRKHRNKSAAAHTANLQAH